LRRNIMINAKEHIYGAIYGQAIGDAIGHPIEFMEFKQDDEERKVYDLIDDNKFTDDTQMFCAIGEALLASPPHLDEEAFMVTLGKKFEEWRVSPLGGSHRAPGGNCMEAVRKLGAGVDWRKAGGLNFKGNGTAMRSGIVGCYYWKRPVYAFRIGCLTSVCTHNNLEPILAAGVVSFLVAALIKGVEYGDAVAQALLLCANFELPDVVPSYPKEVALGRKYDNQNPWYAISRFGAGYALGMSRTSVPDSVCLLNDPTSIVKDGAAVPAVAEAIFFNARYADNFKELVLTAANNSDDTDTIAAISGVIAGARHGIEAINPYWVAKIELTDYLRDLAERTFEASEAYESVSGGNRVSHANPDLVENLLEEDWEESDAAGADDGSDAAGADDGEELEIEF
jgi:ADP-ribosylglycohydrolase